MDVFIEYMVKRKKTLLDYAKVLGILILGLLLIYVVINVFMTPYLASFILVAVAAVIYAMYIFITGINVEYEYILTNSEMDVDSIISKRKRKRLASVNIRQIECWGKISEKSFENYFSNTSVKKIFACKDKKDPETYFVVYFKNDVKNMLLFNPNEKLLKKIELLNPKRGE